MISVSTNDRCYEFWGLSTDTKPTQNISNGSVFIEMDTSKVFAFNEEDSEWVEL